MTQTSPIVVGIDFSDCSRAALAQALRIASSTGSAVHAVHIVDTLVVMELEEALPPMAKAIRDQAITEATRAWSAFAPSVPGSERATFHAALNNRIEGLLGRVKATGAGLLVLGAPCDREPETGFGAMATECVRLSPVDVLLVRGPSGGSLRCVAACVDFSPTSKVALEQAARLALVEKAELRVLHVYEAPWTRLYYKVPVLDTAPALESEYRTALMQRLLAFVGSTGDAVAKAQPACEIFDGGGHRSGIAAYAQQAGADLVVLGTRGRTNLRDTLLGSTAVKALQKTRCSVLAVKPRG